MRSELNYNQLRYFHAIASEGSLTKAARKLGLSQSTLSEHLKKLEAGLGTRLFVRGKEGLRMNDAGRRAFEHVAVMVRMGERLEQIFTNGAAPDTRAGLEVGIASSVHFASARLLPLIARDDLRLRVRHGDQDTLMRELIAYELDLLLTDAAPEAPEERGLMVKVLTQPRLLVVASPQLANSAGELPSALAKAPLLAYTNHSRYRQDIERYLLDHALEPELQAELDDARLMCEAAAAGSGVAIVAEAVAEPYVREGRLRVIGPMDTIRSSIYALFHEKEASELVLKVLESIADHDN